MSMSSIVFSKAIHDLLQTHLWCCSLYTYPLTGSQCLILQKRRSPVSVAGNASPCHPLKLALTLATTNEIARVCAAQREDVRQHINQKSIGTVQSMHELSRQFLLSNTWNRPTCREAIVASNTQIPDTFPSVSCLRILRSGSSGRKFPISPVQGALLTCARLCLRKIMLQYLSSSIPSYLCCTSTSTASTSSNFTFGRYASAS